MTDPAALRIEDVHWAPGGRPVLRGVGLTVEPGEIVGLLGPNGSGKSSLLRCVYRRQRPDRGTVRVDGADVWAVPALRVARRVAAVTQESPADLENHVEQIVALGRTPYLGALGRLTARERELIGSAMARCDIAHLARRAYASLSGGERRRVQLARAFVQEPGLLVLDEPTNHLDLRHQVQLLRVIGDLGVTVIAALHDLQLAAAACDRLVVLHDGRLVAEGPPREVVTQRLLDEVYGVAADVGPGPDGLPRVGLRLPARRTAAG
ncbi:iron complex transport system ATP-binding protein [Sinosporangium album]|uniref:Iron complex transport system ATP-binding protein n=1 Tax=Sinosporangium album TaxID=504805 RepID=A0A1G7ZTU9_9ACTN|nr:ABC transporter ATP-binding protein [Sinosporangium album]SDH11956.1 iron complex transport system ATP-binding protein [Sinosporangium album]